MNNLPDHHKTIREMETYFAKNTNNSRTLRIKVEFEIDGVIKEEGYLDPDEEFMPEVIQANRNKRNLLEAFAILLNVGSKEIYTRRYSEYLKNYFRK